MRQSCHELNMFCQIIYVPGATDNTGVRYVYVTQMAKIVFFCPRPCPPPMRSPYAAPMLFPRQNCRMQTRRLTRDSVHLTFALTGLSARKRHVCPTDKSGRSPISRKPNCGNRQPLACAHSGRTRAVPMPGGRGTPIAGIHDAVWL